MSNRGSLVVVMLLLAGLTASGVAVWHHRQKTKRALELWGTAGSLLIERAPDVTLFRLKATGDAETSHSKARVRIANRDFLLSDGRDMKGAAGFSHVRWGLCQDSSYEWGANCDAPEIRNWDYAIRFADGDRHLMIALSTQDALVIQEGRDRCESISPIAKEVAIVLERQLPAIKSR